MIPALARQDRRPVLRRFVGYAWRGSITQANTWSTLGGAAILFVLARAGWVPDVTVAEGTAGILETAVLSFAAAWPAVFLARLAYSPVGVVREQDAAIQARDQELAELRTAAERGATRANALHDALRVEFESAAPFLRRTVFPVGNARFEAYVRVRNAGDGFLSECVVNLVEVRPEPDNVTHTVLAPLSSLARGEHRYVLVAGFNEQAGGGQPISNDLGTFAFASGPMSSNLVTLPPPSADTPALLTVEAKALECAAVRKRFKLWVGENRRLLMAEA